MVSQFCYKIREELWFFEDEAILGYCPWYSENMYHNMNIEQEVI